MKHLFGKLILTLFTITLISAAPPVVDDVYKIGDQASDFSLKNIDGKMVSLASIKGVKGYIVVFTCNTCPYAVMYEDRIIELHNKYAPQGYPVVAINPNDPEVKPGDSYADMKVRAKEKNFPFNYLIDEKQEVFPEFGATRTPHVFLLDANRYVRYIGAIDDNAQDASAVKTHYLANAIEALQAGDNPDPAETKAIGCTIKVKS
jgi:peroxiredoxin